MLKIIFEAGILILNFKQITAGFFLALVVAIADVYFLMKKLLKVEKLEQGSSHANHIKKKTRPTRLPSENRKTSEEKKNE